LGQYKKSKRKQGDSQRSGARRPPTLVLTDNRRELVRAFPGGYGEDGDEPAMCHHMVWDPKAQRPYDTDKRGWFVICNCHGGERSKKCVPCRIDKDQFGKTQRHKFYSNPYYALNVIHFAKYHVVPFDRGEGTSLRLCVAKYENGKCEHCDEGHPIQQWKKTSLDLDEGAWEDFNIWARDISRKCANCDKGEILPKTATCPRCGENVQSDLDHMLLMEVEKYKCPHCGHNGYMELDHECQVRNPRTDEVSDGCGEAAYYDLWDCDLEIVSEPKPKGKGKRMRLINYHPIAIDDEEILEAMKSPYPFTYYDYCAPSDQASIMGVKNPFESDDDESNEE